jgi:hypothetical protein
MDRKPQAPKYPPQKNFNRNYVSEPKIDNDHIDTIYTNISTGEYDDIIEIIESNKILNFRNKEGETLIHAILKNPSSSLTEQQVLNIIEKLVHKSVSINAMNEYNQTPLHLAAKSGFYDVIEYLISLKSDFNKIDNYGNAPVHYLIDNFVSECKEGEYFKISNKKIKKSSKQIKYEQIAEKYLILNLIEQLENYPGPVVPAVVVPAVVVPAVVVPVPVAPVPAAPVPAPVAPAPVVDKNTPKFLLEKLREAVEQNKFFRIKDINKIISAKKLEIDNLYTKHDPETLESDTKKILYNSVTDFYNLYKDFTFENKISASGESELVNNQIIPNIKTSIADNQDKNIKNFNNKIVALKEEITKIINLLIRQKTNIYCLMKILYFSYYIKITSPADRLIRMITSSIIELFFCDDATDTKFYDFDTEIDNKVIIDNDEQQIFTFFIRSDDFASGKTLEPLPLTYEPYVGAPLIQSYDDASSLKGRKIDIKFTIKRYNKKKGSKFKCILTVLLNILNYSQLLLETINNMKFLLVAEMYQYFYLNYVNEIIINVINNLVVFKRMYKKLNTDKILENLNELFEPLFALNKPIYYVLIPQLNIITSEQKYDTSNPKIKEELEKFVDIDTDDIISKLRTQSTVENTNFQLENIYSSLVKANDNNNKLISNANTHYSLKYLDSFVELMKKTPMDQIIKINNFSINNYFENESKFPDKFSDYIAKYFVDYKFTPQAFALIKTDLLKKYYDYDFNRWFTTNIAGTPLVFKYNKLTINAYAFKFTDEDHTIIFVSGKFNTGYQGINYTQPVTTIDDKGIFSRELPTKALITPSNKILWLKTDNEFCVLDEVIPIVSLDNIKNIIQLLALKIINFLSKAKFDEIVQNTLNQLKKDNIPDKIMNVFQETFTYLTKAENESLLKKVIIEKLIIFINSYIKIQVNKEVNNLLSNVTEKYLSTAHDKADINLISNIKAHYSVQLKKYTLGTMIPSLLKNNDASTLDAIIDAIGNISSDSFTTSGEKKLLLDKCVITNKIDPLRNKLSGKINLRVLDKNGNTILNRLIDQYNEYAISKVLEIDPAIYTYQNNRGENSISYLYSVLNSIDKKYTHDALDKRIRTYESNLQVWIKSDDSFEEIELDNKQQMIYNVILNSLYLFNECMWMILLKSPNGWKYEDKIKLKYIIAKMKKFNVKEQLLIKSLTDADKDLLKTNYATNSLNKKITDMIEELTEEIQQLTNTNTQLEAEKKSLILVDKADIDITLNPLILKNSNLISSKNTEITNLKSALLKFPDSFNAKIDTVFTDIKNSKLIKEISMDWTAYNTLVKDKLWNLYLPIIELANKKNNGSDEKYMSFYNYGLLNLDYGLLDDSEIQLLIDYNKKIINNIYGDYYDLEKYEDIEYNYINDIILNIIYLNVVKVVGIEMYSALIEYLTSKYSSNDKIKKIIENYKNPEVLVLFEVIENLLKNSVWDKLKAKNPEKIKNYQDESFYSNELKSKTKTIFDLLDNEEDNEFIGKIIKFYTGLCGNISYNINGEIVNFLNDLKKHSLLFQILNLIKSKSKSKK